MRKKPLRKGQIVAIEWADIYSDSKWLDEEEQMKFASAKCYSVGIVLSHDENTLKLAHNLCVEDGKSDITAYPNGVIRKVTVLSNVKKTQQRE